MSPRWLDSLMWLPAERVLVHVVACPECSTTTIYKSTVPSPWTCTNPDCGAVVSDPHLEGMVSVKALQEAHA